LGVIGTKILRFFLLAIHVTSTNIFHERTISVTLLGMIFSVIRLRVSVKNVYITNQFQTTFARGGGGEER
jgi:hypothetical protein